MQASCSDTCEEAEDIQFVTILRSGPIQFNNKFIKISAHPKVAWILIPFAFLALGHISIE
jgi:hypothetical protein